MNAHQQTRDTSDNIIIDSRRLISGLRQVLDMNYARVLTAASERWDCNFAGKDPSDACGSVPEFHARVFSKNPSALS